MTRVPTIEEIYNEYHRETMFASKGFYPKSIKDFNGIITPQNRELLVRFQNVLKRNYEMIDWRKYVKACSQYYRRRFDLSVLGSLKGNQIYRKFVSYETDSRHTPEQIQHEIVSSLSFLKTYLEDAEMKLTDYFLDRSSVIPLFLKHLYAGSVSSFFVACIDRNKLIKICYDIQDDIFYELFNMSKNEYLDNVIATNYNQLLTKNFLVQLINRINDKIIL